MVIVVILKVMPSTKNVGTRTFELCGTPACVEYARRLAASANETISACRDFYSHVCGRWNDPKSAWRGLQASFSSGAVTTLTTAGTVESAEGPQSAVRKAALLYRSCERVAQGKNELDRFRPMLEDIGVHWPKPNPNPDVLRTLLRLIDQMNLHILVSVKRFQPEGEQQVPVVELRAVSHYVSEAKLRYERLEAANKARDYFQAFFDDFHTEGSASLDFNASRQLEKDGLDAFAPLLEGDHEHELNETALRRIELGALAGATPDIENSKQRWETQLHEEMGLASPAEAVLMASGRAMDMLVALNGLVKNRTEQNAELFVGWLALQEVAVLVSKNLARAVEAMGSWGAAANPAQRCLTLAEALLGWVVFAPFAATMATDIIRQDIKARTPRSRCSANPRHLDL
ncbi:uncharacterized protein LOC144136510 [Amblyomma americanum]